MARTFAGAQITSSRYDGALGALSEPLDAWVADLIAPYLARHPERERAGDHTFQDRTWRKITLLPWEHYIVKSPALQRLRYIRHLGLSYLTYPSATGSCLEHALGSLARVAAIHDALQRTHPEASILTHRGYEHGVRLSALLHNIGALPLNRVLEPALNSSVTDANEMAEDLFSVKLSLETLLSVLIVSSPEFRKLLEAADLPISDPHLRGEGLTEFLCTCIAGSGHTAGTKILFPQMVAGPISAVTMDEIARAAQETGIHLSLDFEDLLNRMRIITSHLGGVPDVLHLRIDADDRRTSDELLIACDLIARMIRHHPETRAAEELVAQAIQRVVDSAEGLGAVVRWLEVSDEAVLAGSPFRHTAAFGSESTEYVAGAVDLLRRVTYDDLPGRTFAFSPAILQAWPSALCRLFGGRDGLKRNVLQTSRFLESLETPSARGRLAERLASYAGELGCATSFFVVPTPSTSVLAQIPESTGGDTPVHRSGFNTLNWLVARSIAEHMGFVFCDDPGPVTYLAAERALMAEGLMFTEEAHLHAGLNAADIQRTRRSLPATEEWMPHRLAPTFLREEGARRRIEHVAEKVGVYLQNVGLHPIQMINGWLAQFPDPDMQESALRVLEQFRMITRAERGDLVRTFTEQHDVQGAWCFFAPLDSERPKSADLLGYELKDLGPKHPPIRRIDSYASEHLRSAGGIVFLDDVLCTGTQARSLLFSWLGKPELAESPRDLDTELPDSLKAILREVPIRFFFAAGTEKGRVRLLDACNELHLSASVEYGIDIQREGLHLDAVEFEHPLSKARLIQHLKTVGEQLLRPRTFSNARWTEADVEANSLGYGDVRALLGFEYSSPTCTVTALWASSPDRDRRSEPWLPLVPRYPAPVAAAINSPLV